MTIVDRIPSQQVTSPHHIRTYQTKPACRREIQVLKSPIFFPPLRRRRLDPLKPNLANLSVNEEMKTSLKGRYDLDKNAGAATVAFGVGDVKLRATLTDATVVKGPSMNGLAIAVEKPGFFMVDYNVPKKDFRFQFMNSVKVLQKSLNLTYIHGVGDNRTIVDATLVLDSANKVSVNHMVGFPKNGKVKYTYVHKGLTTFEPSYDLGKNTWDFALARKVYDDDVVRATYQPSSKALGLEWSRNSKTSGIFKITAAFDLANDLKAPKVIAESTWNFDL